MTTDIGNWSETTIAGHRCFLFEPEQRNPHGYVGIYLHGVHLGRLQDKIEFVSQFEKYGLPIVAPVTERSWWTDRICPEFDANISAQQHLLENVLPFIAEKYDARPPQIGLFGTSMGGQGALRLAYKFPDKFPVVAAISPAIDYQERMRRDSEDPLWQQYETTEAARQDTATLHIHPLNWPRHQFFCCCAEDVDWWESSERLRMKLYSLGVPHSCELEVCGGGHGFPYYGMMASRVIEFVYESLEKDRRRIV
ncbi:esterase [Blastopirellula sp. JC732]|uniref:Esterase n=1 Tax=Blastopirellula sediminis TaxID=2894196 RepID=A0A9X1SG84_9BACT|nr:alpha/beta hydrolase-fold protein [Blastopirellula sediminis]MCC9607579.1 esterase [Blastopirellula sediminis]MCC9629128.1 esterase [Blastopirellula sediminis]